MLVPVPPFATGTIVSDPKETPLKVEPDIVPPVMVEFDMETLARLSMLLEAAMSW